MKNKTACFFGHSYKSFPFKTDENNNDCIAIKMKIKEQIINLKETYKVTHFISGQGLGVSQWCSEIVLDVKEQYPSIALECALPNELQALWWTEEQRNRYFNILENCDRETIILNNHTRASYVNRDRYMIGKSKFVLAIWNGIKKGSTYNAIYYARRNNKQVIIIDSISLIVRPDLRLVKNRKGGDQCQYRRQQQRY
jgi:uncharacterized phage-like protein YoqJ